MSHQTFSIFGEQPISELRKKRIRQVSERCNEVSSRRLINGDLQEISDTIYEKVKLHPPKLDTSPDAVQLSYDSGDVSLLFANLPIEGGNQSLLRFRPSESHSSVIGFLHENHLVTGIQLIDPGPYRNYESMETYIEGAKYEALSELKHRLHNIKLTYERLKIECKEINKSLRQRCIMEADAQHHRQKIRQEAILRAKIGSSAPKPFNELYDEAPQINTTDFEENMMPVHTLHQILSDTCRRIEDLSGVLAGYNEEALRASVVLTLQTEYGADVTAETLNSAGKTDIRITQDDRPWFIGECAFYYGPKEFRESNDENKIDQLLSYLSPSVEHAALIVFLDRKDGQKALEDLRELIRSHSRCDCELSTGETWPVFRFSRESGELPLELPLFTVHFPERA